MLPVGSKDNPIMFSGGVYVGEHTSQAASVGSVRQGRTDPARSGLLSPLVGKGFAFFGKLKKGLPSGDPFETVEKVSQSLLPAGSKDNLIIFSGGAR